MHDPSDKSPQDAQLLTNRKKISPSPKNQAKCRRRATRIKRQVSPQPLAATGKKAQSSPLGYDPELLYVECGRCGSPVLWEEGRSAKLLLEAGIDPIELDSSCILLTDGCPACGASKEFSVRIFRLSDNGAIHIAPLHGHA